MEMKIAIISIAISHIHHRLYHFLCIAKKILKKYLTLSIYAPSISTSKCCCILVVIFAHILFLHTNINAYYSSSMSLPFSAFSFSRAICSFSIWAMLFSGVGKSSGIVPPMSLMAFLTFLPTSPCTAVAVSAS